MSVQLVFVTVSQTNQRFKDMDKVCTVANNFMMNDPIDITEGEWYHANYIYPKNI